jgi:hypothetical protein
MIVERVTEQDTAGHFLVEYSRETPAAIDLPALRHQVSMTKRGTARQAVLVGSRYPAPSG